MASRGALRTLGSPSRRSLTTSFRPQLSSHAQFSQALVQKQSQRFASTAAADARSLATRTKNLALGTALSLVAVFSYLYVTDTRASAHQYVVVPALRALYPDAEAGHEAGTKLMKALHSFGLHIRERGDADDAGDLSVEVFGHKLKNPIGTSAGIDKLAEIPDALLALGGAIVEVGGATPFAQEGNPKPRVFRLPEQRALINRYGLNSLGAEDMAMRLRERVRLFAYHSGLGLDADAEDLVLNGHAGVPPGSLTDGKLLLVQIAKNKDTPEGDIEAVKRDYVYCVEKLAKYADVLVVNVSSPNTPGLRTLQTVEPLTKLLSGVVAEAQKTTRKTKPKVMVKVSPDEDEDSQIEGIVEAIWRSGVDGVIVGNTTKRRTGLVVEGHKLPAREQQTLQEQGGYSGPQMFQRTLALVKRYRTLLDQGPPAPATSTPTPPATNADEPASSTPDKAESVKEAKVAGAEEIEWNGQAKVIFATGGITNGQQALQILNAGASVAQIYTALVYGGAGTVTRIKSEMRKVLREGRVDK